MCTGRAVGVDSDDAFIRGLLDRGLVRVAENEAIRRLSDPFLKPVERVQWSIRLAQSYMEHAGAVGGEDRRILAEKAEQTLTDLLAVQPSLPRQEEIHAHRALLRASHAEILAWEVLHGGGDQAAAAGALKTAIDALRAVLASFPDDIQTAERRTEAQRADGELDPAEVRLLQRSVEYRLAASLVVSAEILDAGAERSTAMQEADRRLQEFADNWIGDLTTWEARLLRARLARLRGETAVAAGIIETALADQPARWLANRFAAELVRCQLDEGLLDTALQTLLDRSREPGGLNDELRYVQVEALLKARRLARQRGDAATAEALRKEAERIARPLPGGWGAAARLRLDQEHERTRFGPEVAQLIRSARSAYDAGDIDRAVEQFRAAADRALAQHQPDEADELDYTCGSILVSSERYGDAIAHFDRLIARSPTGPRTGDADLLRAYATGKLYAAAPSPELADQYVAALNRHRECYKSAPTAAEAAWMLAAFEEDREAWSQALPLYLTLVDHPERGPAAQLRVAILHERILDSLRKAGQPDDEWEDRAVEDIAPIVRRFPTAPDQLTSNQADVAIRLVRMVIGHREHLYAEAERLLLPVLNAVEHQRRLAARDGAELPGEWRTLAAAAEQLRIVVLAGQGRIDEARRLFTDLAADDAESLLSLLSGLASLSADIPPEHRKELAHLQLETAQQIRLQQPELAPEQRRVLDAVVADAYLAAGNILNAAAFYEKLAGQSPRDLPRVRTAAGLLQQVGEPASLQKAKYLWQQVERMEARGSVGWMEARLQMADCAVRLGRREEALKLIGLTRLVYPELGGPEMKRRFELLEKSASN